MAGAQRLFARMRAEAIAGQYLDLRGQTVGPEGWSVDRALQVTRLKTARYTVTRPLQIGAALAGGPAGLLAAYAAFGDPLGEAFQLRDDVLGCFGSSGTTGKSALDDLRAAKPTVLLAATFARADAGQTAALRGLVGHPGLDEAGAARVLDIMRGDRGAGDDRGAHRPAVATGTPCAHRRPARANRPGRAGHPR